MKDLDLQPEREVSLVELAVGQWVYLMQFAETTRDSYRKLLVPMDLSEDAERVLPQAAKLLRSEGEGILLHVIQPNDDTATDGPIPHGLNHRGWDRSEVMEYLTGLVGRIKADSTRWRCRVIEAPSVAVGIVGYAAREDVDIIVMYVHERKGLANLTRRSITKEVKQKAPVAVRFFRACELAFR